MGDLLGGVGGCLWVFFWGGYCGAGGLGFDEGGCWVGHGVGLGRVFMKIKMGMNGKFMMIKLTFVQIERIVIFNNLNMKNST